MSSRVIYLDRAGSKVFALPVKPDPVTRKLAYRYGKRGIDVLGAALVLPVALPLLLILAVAVKLTSPRQRALESMAVVGMGGAPLTLRKLRSEGRGAKVTRLGVVMRRYGLDELPQLWNVLRGEMSLVGPRPPAAEEWRQYAAWKRRKASVKPGLTGLWQVMGRAAIPDASSWVETDLEYIRRWSLWLDLQILIVTPVAVAMGTGK